MEIIPHDFIIGPVSLTEFLATDGSSKHIYCFGDYHHHDSSSCPSDDMQNPIYINDFLRNTILINSDKIIDLFLEIAFINRESPIKGENIHGDNFITGIENEFKGCFEIDKSNCTFPNLRAHYSDIRISAYFNPLTDLSTYLTMYEGIIDSGELSKAEILSQLLLEIRKIRNTLTFPLDINFILGIPKIKRQLDNIPNLDIKHKLLNFIQSKLPIINIEDLDDIFNGVTSDLRLNIVYFKSMKFKIKVVNLHLKLIEFEAKLMDLYLLARIFRQFSDGTECNNIIIYTGRVHTKLYNEFFALLGFKLVNSSFSDYQCLNISSFKQPFFSEEIPKLKLIIS